jgi:hypothetical protein
VPLYSACDSASIDGKGRNMKSPAQSNTAGIEIVIRHIVFFSARNPEDVEAIAAGLRRLGDIPHSMVFEVMTNTKTDPISGEIDVVVYGEFKDAEALAAYKAHPIYSETTAVVRPLRELRISADVVSTLS